MHAQSFNFHSRTVHLDTISLFYYFVLISYFNFFNLFVCVCFLNLMFTSKATEASFLVVFTDVRLVVPSHCCSKVSWSPDRTFPNLHAQGTHFHKNHTFNLTNIRVLQLCNSYSGRVEGDKSYINR